MHKLVPCRSTTVVKQQNTKKLKIITCLQLFFCLVDMSQYFIDSCTGSISWSFVHQHMVEKVPCNYDSDTGKCGTNIGHCLLVNPLWDPGNSNSTGEPAHWGFKQECTDSVCVDQAICLEDFRRGPAVRPLYVLRCSMTDPLIIFMLTYTHSTMR